MSFLSIYNIKIFTYHRRVAFSEGRLSEAPPRGRPAMLVTKQRAGRLSDLEFVDNYWGSYPLGCNKLPFTSATGVTLTVTGLVPVTEEVANKVVKPTLL